MTENGITLDVVVAVSCEVAPLVALSLVHDNPTTPREAQFSVSDEALEDKSRGCFRFGGFSEERARRVAKRLWQLETMDDPTSARVFVIRAI